MKLADKTVEVHSRGVASSNQFTIQQSSKMFKLLSDSLYSDKVQAVIRELSCNAYDSHIASNNKNLFKVTLPTQANPNFIVRDYGTGLSQEDMENLYTTYGASNKNDSNDFVGCLGLGSKSPFAYTKSFSTTSYYKSKSYTYIAAMDEEGVPSLNLISVKDTNEPNGLEIKFAVKQHDFNEFSTKAKRVFHYFRLKPIIEGGVCVTLNDNTYSNHNVVIEGKGWKIGRVSSDWTKYPSQHNSPGSGVVAIMGNIAYPVDASKIVGEDRPDQPDHIQAWNRAFRKADVDNWKNLVREILNQGLYLEINFNIGELEIDISREGLQYTKQVINALRDRTQDIYLQLKEDMTNKLAGAKSLVEAYQTYYNLSDIAGGWTAGASWTDSNGKVHDLQSGSDLEYKFKKSKQLYVFNFRTAGYRSRRMIYLTDKVHYETLGSKSYGYYGSAKSGKLVFFRCDLKGAETAKKIVTRYCNQNDCYAYLMVDSDTPEDSTTGFDDIIRDIGGESNIVLVSEHKSLIANTNRNKRTRDALGSVSRDSIFLIHGDMDSAEDIKSENLMNDAGYLQEITDQSERDSVLDQESIVYIPILRYASVGDCPSIESIKQMIADKDCADLVKKLFGDTKIFAIKDSYAKKLIKDGYNLVSFNDFFKKSVAEVYDKEFKGLSAYNGLIEYAQNEYGKQEKNDNNYYYNSYSIDKNFLWHILNMFGLDYGKYINDQTIIDLVDKCMIMEFFAVTISKNTFDLIKFKQVDYFAHITKILHGIDINGINSKDIRSANIAYNRLSYWITKLYPGNNDMLKTIKSDDSLQNKLSNVNDLRKQIKESLDKQPMLKYIVCSSDKGNLRELKAENPLSALNDGGYYRRNGGWSAKLDDVESFRKAVSDSIK